MTDALDLYVRLRAWLPRDWELSASEPGWPIDLLQVECRHADWPGFVVVVMLNRIELIERGPDRLDELASEAARFIATGKPDAPRTRKMGNIELRWEGRAVT